MTEDATPDAAPEGSEKSKAGPVRVTLQDLEKGVELEICVAHERKVDLGFEFSV